MNKESAPTKMEWSKLLSDKRLGMERYHDPRRQRRSDFRRDYDRMVFSSPFRRLQNKTQVFPLPGSIFVHNRLTHSLEVSSVGRSLANAALDRMVEKYSAEEVRNLRVMEEIVAAACLCHDLGNPPFGHAGEKTISSYFSEGEGSRLKARFTEQQWSDLVNFEGNANSFRLLTHQFCGRREGGFAMTYATLASIVKYPYSSSHAGAKGKFGFFSSEEEIFRRVAAELGIPEREPGKFSRHPLVYIVEAADDICYQIMDIEDSHRLRILPTEEVTNLFLSFFQNQEQERMRGTLGRLEDPNEQVAYLRSCVIGALVEGCAEVFAEHEEKLLEGKMTGSLVDYLPPLLAEGYQRCSTTAWEKIYFCQDVVDVEVAGNRIMTFLIKALVDAVMEPDKNSSRLILAMVPRQYDIRSADVFERIQGVLDHISGMTDVYALDLYRKLNGHSLPAV